MPKVDYYEKGQLTDSIYLILLTLISPKHGYSIMEEIKILTNDKYQIGPASLYTTIKKLLANEMITFVDEVDRKKTYVISEYGLEILKYEINKRLELAQYGIDKLKEMNKNEK